MRKRAWFAPIVMLAGCVAAAGCERAAPAPPPSAPPTAAPLPATPGPTTAATPTAPEPEPAEYLACGCGCCGGIEPQSTCLYRAKGDTMTSVMQMDRRRTPEECAGAGCSRGTLYRYCD